MLEMINAAFNVVFVLLFVLLFVEYAKKGLDEDKEKPRGGGWLVMQNATRSPEGKEGSCLIQDTVSSRLFVGHHCPGSDAAFTSSSMPRTGRSL